MGQHRSRWYLAPTVVLALITSSGVVGVALGPLFARPVQFETFAGVVAPVAGGQVGQVERRPSLPPATSARPATAPRPAAGRALPITAQPVPTLEPATETSPTPATDPWTEQAEPAPASDPTVAPSPSTSPVQADPTCGGWSE